MTPGLEGTGRVADDLFLLAHNDVTGRPYIQPRPLGLGLAGGLLAELALAGALRVSGDQITVTTGRRLGADEAADRVFAALAAEREDHPVRDWLAYLARTAARDVAARLAAAGYLAPARRWDRWRGIGWVPVNRDTAFAPMLRARAALDPSRPLTVHAGMLAGLADACGLGYRLAEYALAGPARSPGQVADCLDPGLAGLIACTQAAVDSAVLTHRT
jgi:hypothetical protein